ncbi:MAG: peptide ABC transporter substrate-binding protein [Oligoflexales bacterium]|nr:peptide ABC transporter substrate-binding protein [Oligoflexales bacterium]
MSRFTSCLNTQLSSSFKGSSIRSLLLSVSIMTLWQGTALALKTGMVPLPDSQQILKFGNGSEPRELDPSTSTGTPESRILDNLFEGLTQLDPFSFEPVPGVAEKWDISKDGLEYTFYLRKDAKWSDGKALNAHDFVKSWKRALDPKTASEYAYQLYYIKNGEAYKTGKIKDPSLLGFKAINEHTLLVTLEHPTAYFLRLTAFHTLFPTPSHVIAKYPDKEWTKEGKMVSNGPFKMAEWELNNFVKLIPNEHYWDKKKVKLQGVYFYPIENQDTEEKSFFAGELHQTYEVPIIKIPTYERQMKRNQGKYHPYKTHPYLASYFYRFNTTKKPFDDMRVRRAFALTVDRKLLVDRVTRRGELPANSFTPPGVSGYTYKGDLPASVTPEVIKEAQQLLKDAGYLGGKGFPKVELLYNTSENHKKIALAIQQMWKKHLGVEIGIINQEWKVYLNTQRKLNYDISRAGWVGDYPDPNTFLNMFVTDGGQNETGWSNKEYDQLIELAAKTAEQDKRFSYLYKAESILMRELPILPLYIYTKSQLIRSFHQKMSFRL